MSGRGSEIKPHTIVGNFKLQQLTVAAEIDLDQRSFGMFLDVGQGFLDDPIHYQLHFAGKAFGQGGQFQVQTDFRVTFSKIPGRAQNGGIEPCVAVCKCISVF